MSNETSGEALRIPTLFVEESTTKVFESQLKSPVPPVKAVNVPRLVIFVCAAVDNVPANVPPVTVPVVVIAEDPTSILPKPDVIEPLLRAPVVTKLESLYQYQHLVQY